MIGQEHGTTMPIATSSARGAGLVGIDIGGTKIAVLLVSDDGAVLARGSVPAPAALGGGAMADAAADLARELAAQAEVSLAAAGVGAAGVIDHETGTIRAASATFVGWAGFPLADELEQRLGVPVRVENDVNAFLLGEAAADGRTDRDVLGVMLGTGVGGALIIDGDLHHGPHGAAGEIGHTPGYSELVCTCGQIGHLETLASGTSIALRYQERTSAPVRDAREVADRARGGDAEAIAVFDAAGRALALACASAATILDLPCAIVGGGVTAAWDLLEPSILRTLDTDSPVSGIPLRIIPAVLGSDAVALGAIETARRALVPAGAH
ncbi:ROK family protein [Microbacterium maritypicum]|uniref:ROK family protein n=1 Tax=Microbacterium maritypicum TaxID=33918 RepID=UPI002673823D|nr:ROK family protein [Microbacterium liquefaciens]WKT88926.1 ROK family protein [Microbacterium liquefaciens]